MRYRWSWVVVAILLLGMGTAQAGPGESSTTVAVNIAGSIAVVAWPQGFLNLAGDVMPGEAVVSQPLVMSVKSNSPWGITISCDLPDGRMQEFNIGAGHYVADGHVVTYPLQWSPNSSGPWYSLSSSPSALTEAQPPTGDAGKDVQFYLRFEAGYGDLPLMADREYRITLLYTAGLGY